jgi:hypothetical protein
LIIHTKLIFFAEHINAKHNGLMKLAAFLSIFSKKMTALTSPIDASCYVIVALHN